MSTSTEKLSSPCHNQWFDIVSTKLGTSLGFDHNNEKNVHFLTLTTFILWKITRGLSRLAWRVLTLIDENYGGESHEILDKCFKNPFYPWFARRKKDKFPTVFQNISFINQFMNCFITGRGKMYFPLVFEVIVLVSL